MFWPPPPPSALTRPDATSGPWPAPADDSTSDHRPSADPLWPAPSDASERVDSPLRTPFWPQDNRVGSAATSTTTSAATSAVKEVDLEAELESHDARVFYLHTRPEESSADAFRSALAQRRSASHPTRRQRRQGRFELMDALGLLLVVGAVIAAVQSPQIKRALGYKQPRPTTLASMLPATTTTVRDPRDVMPTTAPGFVPPTAPARTPGRTIAAPTPCPRVDGTEQRAIAFASAPPMCIDPAAPMSVRIVTNVGTVTATLYTDGAPTTVNNFVALARYHFLDGTLCWRIVPQFVAQCGDPVGDGSGGPGYGIANEHPATTYPIGSLVMAREKASQFFFVTGDQNATIPAGYTVIGAVHPGQERFLEALNAAGTGHGFPTKTPVWIVSVDVLG